MFNMSVNGLGKNGFVNYILQSQQDTDLLIKDFEDAIRKGLNPNEVEDQIYRARKVNPKDLTINDQRRLKRKVEEIWASNKGGCR